MIERDNLEQLAYIRRWNEEKKKKRSKRKQQGTFLIRFRKKECRKNENK